MGYVNNMTNLLNKIENRMGLKAYGNVPEEIEKSTWAEQVIIPDTLLEFSRYFPREFPYMINTNEHPKKNGYYLLDEDTIGRGVQILGIKDLDYSSFAQDSLSYMNNNSLGMYDFMTSNFGVTDVALAQMRADHLSLFNTGIYPVFEPPNMVRLESATSKRVGDNLKNFVITVFITHRPDLTTISATQMSTFEALAQADVATYLFRYLTHFDNLETVYANIDLKLSDLENEANKRDEILSFIKENYVSAGNKNQPVMFTI